MDKIANRVTISVFVKPEESEAEIESALKKLLNIDVEKEKIQIKKQKAVGFNERIIKILEVTIDKNRLVNKFIEQLSSRLKPEQKELLIRQTDSRLDDDLNFFMRLDKQRLINDDYWITDEGDCYHIKIGIACFPKKRENAFIVIKKIFG
ncbi:MAG: RNA-binding domain-containing protein [Nanoarchaeota archaeon]|nr:RNA-binding domain-containing protein [Nanoarchaeota archaeon]